MFVSTDLSCSQPWPERLLLAPKAVNSEMLNWPKDWEQEMECSAQRGTSILTSPLSSGWGPGGRHGRGEGGDTVRGWGTVLRSPVFRTQLLPHCALGACGYLHRASRAEFSINGRNDLRPHPFMRSYWQWNCQGRKNFSLKTWTLVHFQCSSERVSGSTHGQC